MLHIFDIPIAKISHLSTSTMLRLLATFQVLIVSELVRANEETVTSGKAIL